MKHRKSIVAMALIGLVAFLADRAFKMFIMQNFYLGETRSFIPGLLQFNYVQNTGVAFGFLANHQWVPLVLTPLTLAALVIFLARNKFPCLVQRLALVCVMAGGLGNWVDRLLYGFVVDMIEPTFVRFAVFNIADIFITVGGITFVVAYAVSEWRATQGKCEEETGASDES